MLFFLISCLGASAQSHGTAEAWTEPAPLPSLSGDSDGVVGDHVVVDSAGITTVMSRELFSGGSQEISLVSSSDMGLSWGEPWAFDIAGPRALAGTLAIAADDTLHTVWFEPSTDCPAAGMSGPDAGGCLLVASSSDGGRSWEGPTRISPPTVKGPNSPQLSVDGSGRVHVAWNDGDVSSESYAPEVWYARSPDGGSTWEAAQPLSADDGAMSAFPRFIFKDAMGDVLSIGWRDQRNGTDTDVYVANTADGGETWTEVLALGGPGDQWDPQTLVDPDGIIHLGIMEYPALGTEAPPVYIRTTRSLDGGRTWEPLSTTVEQRSRFAHLMYDTEGGVLWLMYKDERDMVDFTDRRSDLAARCSMDGGASWGELELATDEGDREIGFQGYTISPDGEPVVVFKRWELDGRVAPQLMISRDPADVTPCDSAFSEEEVDEEPREVDEDLEDTLASEDTGSSEDPLGSEHSGLAGPDEPGPEGEDDGAEAGCSTAQSSPSACLALLLAGLVFARRRAGDIEVKSNSSVWGADFRCRQQSTPQPNQETT
jgi:hypothetical protein